LTRSLLIALFQIYTDGFGGAVSIHGNAIIGVSNGGFTLCTWWDKSPVTANAFFEIDGAAIPTLNCDGNPVVLPSANLHLDDHSDAMHKPSKAHVADYVAVQRQVCSWNEKATTAIPLAAEFLKELSSQIAALGGTPLRCL
jgi:hypothetical protein